MSERISDESLQSEQPNESDSGAQPPAPDAGDSAAGRRKTLILSTPSEGIEQYRSQAGEGNVAQLTGFQRLVKKQGPVVPKTILDPDIMRKVVDKLALEKEARLRDLEPQPFKPVKSIKQFKQASICKSSWDNMSGDGKVRYC